VLLTACQPANFFTKPTSTSEYEDNIAVQAVISALTEKIAVNETDIVVITVEKVTWRDSCLGISVEGAVCADVITPGYSIIVKNKDVEYEAHTNEDGSVVIFKSSPSSTD
jgi:hypothetical protein